MVAKIKANALFVKVADRPDNPEESLKYGQQIVKKLFAFTRVLRWLEIAFVAMLAVVSLILINNSIRLAIYARRKEIGIMRLVGASNWFIRTPFLLEGLLQSLIGAGLAILSIVGLQALIMPRLGEALPFLPVGMDGGATLQISAGTDRRGSSHRSGRIGIRAQPLPEGLDSFVPSGQQNESGRAT